MRVAVSVRSTARSANETSRAADSFVAVSTAPVSSGMDSVESGVSPDAVRTMATARAPLPSADAIRGKAPAARVTIAS
jgi:hypothetical protein